MKLTSGRRRQERQSRALDRLLAQDPAEWCSSSKDLVAADEQWKARRLREIATLLQRTGRIHEYLGDRLTLAEIQVVNDESRVLA